eukprot:EG_transcript_14884
MAACVAETTPLAGALGTRPCPALRSELPRRPGRMAWAVAAALLGLLLCLALTGASGPLARGTDLAKPPPAPLGVPRAYGLPTFLSSAQLNNAKTIARLDEDIELERQLLAALADLQGENAAQRNAALRRYVRLTAQSARRAVAAAVRNAATGAAGWARRAGKSSKEGLATARDFLQYRFPTASRVVHRAWTVVVGAVELVLPPLRHTAHIAWASLSRAVSPILGPAAETAKSAAHASAAAASEVLAESGRVLQHTAATALDRTVGQRPRATVAGVGAALLLEHRRRVRVREGRRGWRSVWPSGGPEDDGCPEGMAAVTVVGMGAPQCALVPVCAAANGLGNCPSATPEFPYRSSCRAVAPDVYGCVLDELEAPLEEEVQS